MNKRTARRTSFSLLVVLWSLLCQLATTDTRDCVRILKEVHVMKEYHDLTFVGTLGKRVHDLKVNKKIKAGPRSFENKRRARRYDKEASLTKSRL